MKTVMFNYENSCVLGVMEVDSSHTSLHKINYTIKIKSYSIVPCMDLWNTFNILKGTAMFVQIRTWEDMLEEYRLNRFDNIDVPAHFTSVMESLMPDDRIIEVTKGGSFSFSWMNGRFNISKEMIENQWEENPRTKMICTSLSKPQLHECGYFIGVLPTGYLHSDLSIQGSTGGAGGTGYFKTEQQALFAKLRYERIYRHLKPKSSKESI
jgi:hypothetical protein